MKHFDVFLIYMQDKPFNILTNETRLDNSISDSEYDIVGHDRNKNAGGVAMYIRSKYHLLIITTWYQ